MLAIPRLLDLSVRAAGRRYARGEIDRATMNAHRLRVDRLHTRAKYLTDLRRRRVREARLTAMLVTARAALDTGARIVAFDTEFTQDGPVEQLGIAILERGQITTATYTAPDCLRDYAGKTSLFGPDHVLDRPAMVALAQQTYAGAALNVFHAVSAERDKLHLDLSQAPYADTAVLSHLHIQRKGNVPSLRLVCEFYGIDFRGHHNAGNDAHHTLLALVAMAKDHRSDRLAAGLEMESQRQKRLLIMYPTRKPVPNLPAYEALRLEIERIENRIRERERKARQWRQQQAARLAATASAS